MTLRTASPSPSAAAATVGDRGGRNGGSGSRNVQSGNPTSATPVGVASDGHDDHRTRTVTLLILGAGWTYQFLQPLLSAGKITYAATTTTGHDGTIPFRFDEASDDLGPFKNLPDAEYVLVTFPLKGRGPSAKLVRMYNETRRGHGKGELEEALGQEVEVEVDSACHDDSRPDGSLRAEVESQISTDIRSGDGQNPNSNTNTSTTNNNRSDRHIYSPEPTLSSTCSSNNVTASPSSTVTKWIQLGSTGIWTTPDWNDSSSPIDDTNARAVAEEELITLNGCILNLAGLYGGERNPRNWVSRVARSKEQLGQKGALHLIHGRDVARAVVGVVRKDQDGNEKEKGTANTMNDEGRVTNDGNGDDNDRTHTDVGTELFGRRWIVADCVSYDWWNLVWDWMGEHENSKGKVEGGRSEQVAEETTEQKETQKQKERKMERDMKSQYRRWVMELMEENNVRGLPRSMDVLGRKLDARDFWKAIGILPEMRLER
ncbi:hypothetical protein A1O1_01121 [Capronia coronata CBS 617.96]|uniref:Uncharacterized protein n=1 Tax=Capronia coronata CBS 617.96 TaxID=1182541 RepID=W9Z225_9EURO|nr:uncharacterized protein A1O1_01121 [Capronia coronata CBS 617.96]EXJ95995.1 hypothetical protein A1O1_01121 [Capronia coronata CBS 617.96]